MTLIHHESPIAEGMHMPQRGGRGDDHQGMLWDSTGDVYAALDERTAVAVEASDRYGDCAGEVLR